LNSMMMHGLTNLKKKYTTLLVIYNRLPEDEPYGSKHVEDIN